MEKERIKFTDSNGDIDVEALFNAPAINCRIDGINLGETDVLPMGVYAKFSFRPVSDMCALIVCRNLLKQLLGEVNKRIKKMEKNNDQ